MCLNITLQKSITVMAAYHRSNQKPTEQCAHSSSLKCQHDGYDYSVMKNIVNQNKNQTHQSGPNGDNPDFSIQNPYLINNYTAHS